MSVEPSSGSSEFVVNETTKICYVPKHLCAVVSYRKNSDKLIEVQFLFHDGYRSTYYFKSLGNVKALFEDLQSNWQGNYVSFTYDKHDYIVLIRGSCVRHLTRKDDELSILLCHSNVITLRKGSNMEANYQALRRQIDANL